MLDQRAGTARLATLLDVVEITYLLASREEREAVPTARFRQAEAALGACFGQLSEGSVTLEATEREAIGQILAMHDRQLLSVASHRYPDAQERLKQLAEAGRANLNDDAIIRSFPPSVVFQAAVNKLGKQSVTGWEPQ